MSGTLISSLVWVPRGRAALQPKKYTLDEEEIQRVGKLGGPGALEKLQAELQGVDIDPEAWEDVDETDDDGSEGEKGDAGEEDGDMEVDEQKPQVNGKDKVDPNDMSAFKMDEYDDEQSGGVAMGAFANVKGLSFYRDNKEDPYITLKEVSLAFFRLSCS